MAILLKRQRVLQDTWRPPEPDAAHFLRPGETGFVPDFPADGDLIFPLSLWRARRDDLLDRPGRLGVLLEGHDEPDAIAADLDRLALVAIRIPVFTDGRGYSLARALRDHHGYRGELRAVGDVLRDQLFYLAAVGFDAFELRDDQDADAAVKAFDDFSESYQATVTRAPLFRRRHLPQPMSHTGVTTTGAAP